MYPMHICLVTSVGQNCKYTVGGQKGLTFYKAAKACKLYQKSTSPGLGPALVQGPLLLWIWNPAEKKHTLPSETDATEEANRGPEEYF